MQKLFLFATAVLFPLMVQAQNAPPADPSPMRGPGIQQKMGGHEMTLDEARKRAHEHAAELDKMTPQEWQEHEQRRKAFFAKIDNMTPEQRKKFFAERQQRREAWESTHPMNGAPPAPAAGGSR